MSSSVGNANLGTMNPPSRLLQPEPADDQLGGGAGWRRGAVAPRLVRDERDLIAGNCESGGAAAGPDSHVIGGRAPDGAPVAGELDPQQPAIAVGAALERHEPVPVRSEALDTV